MNCVRIWRVFANQVTFIKSMSFSILLFVTFVRLIPKTAWNMSNVRLQFQILLLLYVIKTCMCVHARLQILHTMNIIELYMVVHAYRLFACVI